MSANRPNDPRFPLSGITPTIGIPDNKFGIDGSLAIDQETGALYVKYAGAWAALVDLLADALPSPDPGYKIYRALITQSGTDAPVATILENTLGGVPVWTRTGVGRYTLTLSGGFIIGKTFPFSQSDTDNSAALYLTSGQDNNDSIVYFAADGLNVQTDLGGGLSPVEILVYP
jgi:hypothetical protein